MKGFWEHNMIIVWLIIIKRAQQWDLWDVETHNMGLSLHKVQLS